MANELTGKQKLFCEEYIIDLNATQAAIRAGYSENTSSEIGYENLNKPQIQEYLQRLMAKRAERTQITQDRVLQEYARLAFMDVRKLYNEDGHLKKVQDLDDDTAAAIGSIDVNIAKDEDGNYEAIKKYKMVDKKGALDSIGKHLGMFVEKHEFTNTPTVKVINMTGKKDN